MLSTKMCKLFLHVMIQLGSITWSRADIAESKQFDVREKIAELVQDLYPLSDICDVNATSAVVRRRESVAPGFISCCKGCSCHPDCKQNDNCCYPDDYKSNIETQPTTKLTECLHTRLGQPEMINNLVPAYETIVAKPEGGCVDTPIKISPKVVLQPTCDDIDVTPVGPYYPVFSRETGAVYKNVLCARCHGILNTEPFSPNLVCQNSQAESIADNSITNFLNLLETGYLPPECHVDFNFTDFPALRDNRCFTNIIDTCTGQSVSLPLGFNQPNLTFDVIRSMCNSGLYSPTIDAENNVVYRNAFCSLCASRRRYSLFLQCVENDRRTTFYDSFSFLFDTKMMHTINKSPNINKKNEVCLIQKGADKVSKGHKTCKPIYCPTGKIRNEEGKCELIGSYLDTSIGVVFIKLTPTENVDFGTESQEDFIKSLVQGLTKNNPWPVKWEMDAILYRLNFTKCAENAIAAITLRWRNMGTKNIYDDIEDSIRFSWQFEWKERTYYLKQSLMEYTLVWIPEFSDLNKPSWQQSKAADLPTENYFGCGPMRWAVVFTSVNAGGGGVFILVKKLFFCHQIQLRSDEFVLGYKRSYLESNLTKRTLHDLEFDIVEDRDGSSARVCLKDTVFANRSANDGITLKTQRGVTVLFLLLYIVFRPTFLAYM